VDPAGSVLIADAASHRIRKVTTDGIITTVAGNGTAGSSGDGGAATNATLQAPFAVVLDGIGNLLFSDTATDTVRRVDTNGVINMVAGPANNAQLFFPVGLVVNSTGTVLIADRDNNRVRMVDTNGTVTTIAGNGSPGYSGNGGYATNASFNWPSGLALNPDESILIADSANNVIRKLSTNGVITTVAGGGNSLGDFGDATNSALVYPVGMAVDAFGNFFIADIGNNRIRKVSAFGDMSTLTLSNVTSSAGRYQVIVSDMSGTVTSRVATLTVVRHWPAFVGSSLNSDGSLTLNLFNPAGIPSRLWFTTNLASPAVWEPLDTNLAGGYWQVTDTNTSSKPMRFYRLSWP